MLDAIFAVLLESADVSRREGDVARRARLYEAAVAIEQASFGAATARADEAALHQAAELIAVGWHESRFSRNIAEGRCLVHQCDGGRARSYWQVWRVSCPELWGQAGSAAGVGVAAECAARVLGKGREVCSRKTRTEKQARMGSFARYARGHGCRWSGAAPRYRTFERVLAQLVSHVERARIE